MKEYVFYFWVVTISLLNLFPCTGSLSYKQSYIKRRFILHGFMASILNCDMCVLYVNSHASSSLQTRHVLNTSLRRLLYVMDVSKTSQERHYTLGCNHLCNMETKNNHVLGVSLLQLKYRYAERWIVITRFLVWLSTLSSLLSVSYIWSPKAQRDTRQNLWMRAVFMTLQLSLCFIKR